MQVPLRNRGSPSCPAGQPVAVAGYQTIKEITDEWRDYYKDIKQTRPAAAIFQNIQDGRGSCHMVAISLIYNGIKICFTHAC